MHLWKRHDDKQAGVAKWLLCQLLVVLVVIKRLTYLIDITPYVIVE